MAMEPGGGYASPADGHFEAVRVRWHRAWRSFLTGGGLLAQQLDGWWWGRRLAYALCTFALFLPLARIGVDPHHDGIMLKPAFDLANGMTLFRDSFNQYGFLTTFIQSLFVRVCGPTLWAIKLATLVFVALSAALLTAVWEELLPKVYVLLAFAFWCALSPDVELIFHPWSSYFGLAFLALGAWLLMRGMRGPSVQLHFLGGVSFCLAALCRTPLGIVCLSTFVGLLVVAALGGQGGRRAFRPVAAYVAGGLAVAALFFAWLLASGTLGDWFRQCLAWPRLWSQRQAGYGQGYFPNWRWALLWLGGYAVWGLLFRLAWRDWATRGRRRPAQAGGLALLLVLAALAWSDLLFNWRADHWFAVLPWCLVAVLAATLAGFWRTRTLSPYAARLLLLAAVGLGALHQYMPVTCVRHMFWAISISVVLILVVVRYLAGADNWGVVAGLALLLLPVLRDARQTAWRKLDKAGPPSQVALLHGMRPEAAMEEGFLHLEAGIAAYERTHGPTPIYNTTEDALWNCFAGDLRNPGPVFVSWPAMLKSPARETAFIALRRPLIVCSEKQSGPPVPGYELYCPIPVLSIALYAPAPPAAVVRRDLPLGAGPAY